MEAIYVNINGSLETREHASIPTDSRAFRYGYGLFETMRMQGGIIRQSAYHWKRLFHGLDVLGFEIPKTFTAAYLEEQIIYTAAKNNLTDRCRVRLQMFAGAGFLYDTAPRPNFLIECFPLASTDYTLNDTGLTVGMAKDLYKSYDQTANLKSCNSLLYVLAAQQAAKNGWDDALIMNTTGNVIESTVANIFCIKGNTIITPPLTDGCIAGTMRSYLIDELLKQGITVQEQSIKPDTMPEYDTILLTNAIKGVSWVRMIDESGYEKLRMYNHPAGDVWDKMLKILTGFNISL